MAPKAIGPDDKIPVSSFPLYPPSLPPLHHPLTDLPPPQCPTIDQLHTELSLFQQSLNLDETEDTWEKIERAILRFAAVTRGGGAKFGEEYVRIMGGREMGGKIVRCVSQIDWLEAGKAGG